MKWFNNLKIASKLITGFVMVAMIAAIVGIVGIVSIRQISESGNKIYTDGVIPSGYLTEIVMKFEQTRIESLKLIAAKSDAERRKYTQSIMDLRNDIGQLSAKYEKTLFDEKDKKLFAKFGDIREKYVSVLDRTIELCRNQREAEAMIFINTEGAKYAVAEEEAIIELLKYNEENAKLAADYNTASGAQSTTIMILAILFGIILAVGLGIFVAKLISNPLKLVVETSVRLANGDFTEQIHIDTKDEIGVMASSLNTAITTLERTISEIMVASQNLSQAVQQIASGNQNLSQRTSEQASALEEIASTIEEATANIRQNAENANQANKLTIEGAQKSDEGGTVVVNAVDSINDINQSSKKIGEIISVINEIAFQTNLLALNAAVEAARAGEQGRGFAVVAGEVRNLAQRSGNAAKEIGELIKDSLEKVAKGTTLVNRSGEVLNEIISAAKKTAEIISEIAASSEEQKRGMDQINIAVSEMDSMTQQNAALVEETASASEEMASQAEELLSMMQRFLISDEIKGQVYALKHKEIHLTANVARDVKKELAAKKEAGARIAAKDVKETAPNREGKGTLGEALAKDGFEEF